MEFASVIKGIRNELGQTQVEFANGVGITQTYLSQLESGKKDPSKETIKAICAHSKTPPAIFAWKCVTEGDVPKEKVETFKILKPIVDDLIKAFKEDEN